jgi:DNA end-binding protein Ku
MRAIWKGAISWGLVTIPVGLYSAIQDRAPKFKLLHSKDHGPIRYKRTCETCGEEVAWEDIVRGYEVEKGHYVVFSEEELEAGTPTLAKTVDVVQFVESEEIDPIYYRSSYYLGPEKSGVKAYKLFLEALTNKQLVGLAKVAIRDREYLATLRPSDGVLVLETMYWPDEIREPAFEELETKAEFRPQELKQADTLIDNLTAPFKPDEWHDTSRELIEELAQRKIEGEEIVAPEVERPAKVADLLEALKASVEATKKAG